MPRYDYQCTSCGNQFELRQSFSEAGSGTCPQCSGEGRRVYHAVPVIYKGSGFYTTDYARPKPPVEKEETKKTETSGSSSSNSSSSNGASSSSETKSDSSQSTTSKPSETAAGGS